MTLKARLQRWRTADIIDAATAQRIQTYEDSKPGFGFSTAMFALGALAIVLGVAAVVASNWDAIPAIPKLVAHAILNAALAAGAWRAAQTGRTTLGEILSSCWRDSR